MHRTAARPFRPSVLLAAGAAALSAACGSSSLADRDAPPSSGEPRRVVAQQAEPRVDLPGRVSLLLRVFNGDGTPAADLTGADFNIFEDGQLVSQSESFQRVLPQPQEFRSYQHLIIDRSNSVQTGDQTSIVNAALAYVDAVTEQESSFVKVSWFDGSEGLYPIEGHDLGYTNDGDALRAAILDLFDGPVFSPSTNLYGAVLRALDDLDDEDVAAAQAGVDNRALALVTFTDGTHQVGNGTTLDQVTTRLDGASAQGTPFSSFTIGVGQEIDPFVLSAIGKDGAVSRDDFDLLVGAFESVAQQVRDLANSYYFLSYCSPKTAGQYELAISVREIPDPDNDVNVEFSADGFGAGCAFLDVENHADLAGGRARSRVAGFAELPGGGAVAVGWRTEGCGGPGCNAATSAFVARFRTSPAALDPGESPVDGRLDTTFGSGGQVVLDAAFDVAAATSVAVDPQSGTIFVGGWVRPAIGAGPAQAKVWSLAADGTPLGEIQLPNPSSVDQAVTSLARAASGELLAGGSSGTGSRSFAVWRLQSNLGVDLGFGDGGVLLHPQSQEFGNEGVRELVLGGAGRVYAVGRAGGGVRAVALDGTSGALIPAFGGTGVVELVRRIGGVDREAFPGGAALDGQGRLVVGGTLRLPGPGGALRDQPAVWRVLDSGAADTSFAGSLSSPSFSTGVVTLREGSTGTPGVDFGSDTRLEDLTIAPDGTILATGWRVNLEDHTDMATLAFDAGTGISSGDYNFVGFVIDDGAVADDSHDRGSLVHVLPSGAIWVLGTSAAPAPGGGPGSDVPTVWVDRDPSRAFAPIGD